MISTWDADDGAIRAVEGGPSVGRSLAATLKFAARFEQWRLSPRLSSRSWGVSDAFYCERARPGARYARLFSMLYRDPHAI